MMSSRIRMSSLACAMIWGHGEIEVNAAFLETILKTVMEKFEPTTPVTMTFRKAHFASGHDLKDFAEKLGIELQQGEVEQ